MGIAFPYYSDYNHYNKEVNHMAHYCLECFNRICNTHYQEYQVKLSDVYDLCDSCGELHHVVDGLLEIVIL